MSPQLDAHTLCLGCSSSLSPQVQLSAPFTTPCCIRPICERCLSNTPRLRGYNPCLACLDGVAVVGRSGTSYEIPNLHVSIPGTSGQSEGEENNVFVLGNSDDEDNSPKQSTELQDSPPPYTGISETRTTAAISETLMGGGVDVEMADEEGFNFSMYYIQPGDSLRGIALRYGVDGRKLCQFNSLPFSTLSTTPHLLHTRRWLKLSPTGRRMLHGPMVLEEHSRERAEKRFQFVTKEIDWRVAKTYVALAEAQDDSVQTKESIEVLGRPASEQRALEAKAVDQYLDDREWEAGQSGGPQLQGFLLDAQEKKILEGQETFPAGKTLRKGKCG